MDMPPPPPPINYETDLPPPPPPVSGNYSAPNSFSNYVDDGKPKDTGDPTAEFTILERLGKGSFGAVYKAMHKTTGLSVAIKKCVLADMEENLQEIEIMRECEHPSIVKYFGNYIFDEHIWIVMEYCALGGLNDSIRLAGRNTLNEREIASLTRSIVNGLAYLHSTGKMHRDIKPENILLNSIGEPKLADFGVAGKVSTMDKRQTLTGTPYYIAPEILRDDLPGYDAKADIWSLGATIMELAQGEPPYADAQPMRVMLLIAKNPPPTLKEPQKFGKELKDFLATCMVKEPKNRPSAKELLFHKFLAHAEQPSVIMADFANTVSSAIFSAGGIENALKKLHTSQRESVKNKNPPLSASNSSDVGQPGSFRSSVEIPGSPATARAQTTQPSRGRSSTDIGSPILMHSTNTTFASGSPSNYSTLATPDKKMKKEKREKKEKKDKKEKKESRDKTLREKKEKRSSQIVKEPVATYDPYGTASSDSKTDGTMEKGPLKKMLTRFFGGSRPTKDDLVKKKILNSVYEDQHYGTTNTFRK